MSSEYDRSPLYAKLEAALTSDILTGVLPLGAQLPPEDRLIERFNVSRTTVRKAIENLVARGLVEIRRGKGTFVAPPKITQELTELTGFVEDMQALGRSPTAKLLDKRLVPADADVARQLAVPPGSLVMRIQRVRLADGVTMSFDETYLPREIGEKVITHDLDAEPIFSLLEDKYALPLTEAEYRLEAVTATPDVAHALAVDCDSAVFLIERTSYTEGHRPIDYERLHYRGDLIRFVTRLARRPRERS
ncbi:MULTISPECIES: GntR family transcriptional regulator [Ochrobactrum]|jgi:GntR family transcriptional regulator|uniref:GntR family transcriptional regulator n=1 Tax=Ochrobactrum TaxID=528 RepID=UPI0017823D5C|nr:GntR family transcriptional regulator [Ochrobactrum sp. AN78]MBD7989707.1 GntR family transcriptional regulator [Ochrobactrum gallinarum]MDH7791174.1 GntR family transcriptional regulator [Ochrobactrum sp. AN78]